MDFKKTILWAVFSLSGMMLYNNWMVHEGKPSLFGGAPATTDQQVQSPTTGKADIPTQVSGAARKANAEAPTATGAAVDAGERFVLQNDVLALEISANGANVVDAKLLKELTAEKKPVELFQQTPTHTYIARSGLIAMGNAELPNHTSAFKVTQSGKDGSGRPFVVLVSERNGVRLEKTFILTPGSYVVDVGHRVTQATASTTPLVLYTEILRDGSQEQKIGPFGGAFSASTFTGPAVYTTTENSISLNLRRWIKTKLPSLHKFLRAIQPGLQWFSITSHRLGSPEISRREIFTLVRLI